MNEANGNTAPIENMGDTEEVRAGLYAALVEAFLRFLTATIGGVDVKGSRKANHYAKKDAMTMNQLVAVARFVGINAKKVTGIDLLRAGVLQLRGIVVNGRPMEPVAVTSDLMAQALAASGAVGQAMRRAAAAIVAFDQWQTADLAARQEMVARSGQEVLEVPEGHTPATQAALAAFGLKEGSFVRHVVIEAAAMLRASFIAIKANLQANGQSIINAANIRTTNENGTATHLDASEDTHLMLNINTVVSWFRSCVFPTARYCSKCKKAGLNPNHGAQQVKNAGNQCPNGCGTPARELGRNSNTGHLPVITTAQAGLKVVGGWRVHMASFIMPKDSFNALMKASLGLMAVEDAFTFFMSRPVDLRYQQDGKTVKGKARLVPVCYEMQGQTGGFELHYGLALEMMHTGDL